MFANLVAGNVHRFEMLHHRQSGEFQGVVLVGFAFDVGPASGLFVGAADQGGQVEILAQIGDPAVRAAGFHHDQVDRVVFEQG